MSNDAPTTTRRRTSLIAAILGLALAATACGGDDATEAGGSEGTEAPPTSVSDTDGTGADEAADGGAMADEAMADDTAAGEAMADDQPRLDLTLDGLEPLGTDFDYEVWTIVDDTPVSGGTFDIADDGSLAITAGDHLSGHPDGSAVVITIEPEVGDDPAPADTHVLAGDLADDGTFELTIDHPAALGTDFADAVGGFLLGTPTNDPDGDELSGVWFLTIPGPEASLELPTLPAGWAYEGWVVIDGIPVTTGRFLDGAAADDFAGFSGPNTGPNYPGEDFIVNAPDGLSFPTDLTGATVVISVEPDADNSPAPFALKPLVADVPAGTGDHQNLVLGAGSVALSGSGTIG